MEGLGVFFRAQFLLVAVRKNNVFLRTPQFGGSSEADNAESRFQEIIFALMGL